MRYLTKEWYNRMQQTCIHCSLQIDKRAEKYSDKFYKKIYNKIKKQFIKNESNYTNYKKYKKMYLKNSDNSSKITEEEIQRDFKKYNDNVYDGMSVEEFFDLSHNNMIEYLKNVLPKNILKEVKDIRLLALNYSSYEVYTLIKEYCLDNQKFMYDRLNEYGNVITEQFKNESIDFLNNSFHDAVILEVKYDKNDLIMKLDSEFTNEMSATFKNYEVILDETIEECVWLYEEIYKIDSGYEIHILAHNYKKDELKELIIKCDDIILK